jgi:serine/threonine protein kinase
LLELVYSEVMLRQEQGEPPQPEEYVRRFPQLAERLLPLFEVHWVLESEQLRAEAEASTQMAEIGQASPAAAAADPPALAGYEILGELGRGGMSIVVKAYQRSLRRHVALKMILPARAASPAEVQRFIGEAEDVAKLDHPNIVPIYEVNVHDGKPYFTMKFVEGGSLASRIRDLHLPRIDPDTRNDEQGKAWTSRELRKRQRDIAGLVATIARAVHHAHERGILHRDLKPGNVLLDGEGKPHVTDFGLAKRFEAGNARAFPESLPNRNGMQGQSSDDVVTQEDFDDAHGTASYIAPEVATLSLARTADSASRMAGTPPYMAPEQVLASGALTPALDVYGLGAILYELLTGRPPFRGASLVETLQQICEREPVTPSALRPNIARDLEAICLKCLAKEPQRRYRSAANVADDLSRYLGGQSVQARPAPAWERGVKWVNRRRAWSLVLLTSMLLLASALGIAGLWRRSETHRFEAEDVKARHAELEKMFQELSPQQQKDYKLFVAFLRKHPTLTLQQAMLEFSKEYPDVNIEGIDLPAFEIVPGRIPSPNIHEEPFPLFEPAVPMIGD